MTDIDALKQLVKKFHTDRGWSHSHKPKDIAMDIAIEAGELMEHFIWREGKEADAYIAKHKEDIEDELSDVLHGVILMADTLNIDIMHTFAKKMQKNEVKYPAHVYREKLIQK